MARGGGGAVDRRRGGIREFRKFVENVRFDRQRRLYKICVGDELFSSMLAFFQSFVFLALQHLLLHAIMPTLKKTLEKVIGPSPTERARVLNVELQRIRDEGITLRGMLSQIIEERGARDAELLRYGARMRLAGMLSAAEVEVLSRTEDRLRRRGIVRGALLGPDVVAQSMEDMSMADFGPNHPDNIVLGPLRMQDDDVSMGRSRSCSRCLWLCLFILVLVLAVTGLAALLGALTRPYIL